MSRTALQGQLAVVTGASSGIGWAICHRLVDDGMVVVATARREARLQALQQSVSDRTRLVPVVADARDEGALQQVFDVVDARAEPLAVLVNNAGLGHKTSLHDGDTALWREILDVNVLALTICTREALQRMDKTIGGHIVHISSMSAHRVPDGSGMYSASKHAVKALTEALRKELRERQSQVRVTSISPGFVETEFAARYHKSEAAAAETYGRFQVLRAEDVADAVAYVVHAPPHVEVHDLLLRPTEQTS